MSLDVQAWVFVVFYILATVGFAELLRAALSENGVDEITVWASIFFWLVLPVVGIIVLIVRAKVLIDKLRGKRGESV